MKIIAIIVTYNGEAWIKKCLTSLFTSNIPLEVIVVDNASSDQTIKIIRDHFPTVRLFESKINDGFGKANNVGLKIAVQESADYVFLLNQDAWVYENTINELVKIADKNPSYGIISPFHLSINDNQLERQFIDFLTSGHNEELLSDMFFHRLKSFYETTYIHAAAWLISKDCLNTVGGFDPIYTHYGEDDDYMQRAKHFGYKLALVPSALITHDASYKSWDKVEWDENRNIVYELQHLKRMVPNFRSNVLSYLKRSFDELTTLLLFRKFKKFRFRFKVMYKTIMRLKTIRLSYKASFTKGAFLNG